MVATITSGAGAFIALNQTPWLQRHLIRINVPANRGCRLQPINRRRRKWLLIAAAWIGWALHAAAAQELGNGKAQYMNSCAVCHGPEGKGDGPMGDELVKRPADLTRLSRQNGGEFPYWRVFTVIDGRTMVPEHGERDMPVWGRQFLPGDAKKYGPNAGEIVTTERIHDLAGYVQTLQR